MDVPICSRLVWIPPKPLPGTVWSHSHTPLKRRGIPLTQPATCTIKAFLEAQETKSSTGINWWDPVISSIYLTKCIPWDCIVLGSSLPVLYVLSASTTHVWWKRFAARALLGVWDLEVAQQVKHPTWLQFTAVVKSRSVRAGCAWGNPEQTANKPDLAKTSKGRLWLSLLQCTYCGAIWVHQVEGWEGEASWMLLAEPWGIFHLLPPSLNISKFLIWLILSNCSMG